MLSYQPALAAVALAVALTFGAADADADAKSAVRIVSPAPDALIVGRSVPVRLDGNPATTGVRVFAATKDVTGRFTRHGHEWTASLPRDAFKPGSNRLLVQSRAGKSLGATASVAFVVDRPEQELMSINHSLSMGPAGTTGYRPASGQIPVSVHTRTATFARLSVNGRRVTDDPRARIAMTDHSWVVSLRDGLKSGRNVVEVSAWDRDGRHAVKRWSVNRDAGLPLAEAGAREHATTAGAWVGLDGSGSRGAKLGYEWRVVKAPAGARPQLRGEHSARPSFKPDVPGVYQLALRTTHVGVATAAQATAAEDVTTVSAGPPLAEQGMWIDTTLTASSTGAPTLSLGGATYPLLAGGYDDPLTFGIVLDPTTLAPTGPPTQAWNTKPAAGTITLTETQQGLPASADYHSKLWIGTDQVGEVSSMNPQGFGDYALKGWLTPAGSLTGNTGDPAWVSGDMVAVKTRVKGLPANANAMEVNGQVTPTETLSGGNTSGFQLLTLDAMLRPTAPPGLYQFGASAASDQANLDNLVDALEAAATDHNTILLQGIGTLKPVTGQAGGTDTWTQLAQLLSFFGGNADVVGMLDGTADASGGAYALIAGFGTRTITPPGSSAPVFMPYSGQEMSYERTQQSGTLSAALVRDPVAGTYSVLGSDAGAPDAAGVNRQAFAPQVYGAPTSYGARWLTKQTGVFITPSVAQQAAMTYITSYAASEDWTPTGTNACTYAPDPVRGAYCEISPSMALHDHLHDDISFDAADAAKNGYTQDDFNAAQETLLQETTLVQGMRSMIQTYEQIFDGDSTVSAADLTAATKAITDQITASETPTTTNTFSVLTGLAALGESFDAVNPIMTLISNTMAFASNFLPHSSPQTLLPTVQTTATTLATEIANSYQNAYEQLDLIGDYIAADPVKLQTLGNELITGTYSLSGDNNVKLLNNAVQHGVNQTLWGTLIGAAYDQWQAPINTEGGTLSKNPTCNRWQPFANVEPSGYWGQGQTVEPNLQYWIALAESSDPRYYLISHSKQGLGTITDTLFEPANADAAKSGVGLVMPYFAVDYLKPNTVPIEGDPNNPYDWGCTID